MKTPCHDARPRSAAAAFALSCLAAASAFAPACARRHAPEPASLGAPGLPGGGDGIDPGRRAESAPAVLDMVRDFDACALGHRGVLLDFGDPSIGDNLRPGFLGPADDEVIERGGASWLRVRSRTLSASFYWPAVAGDAPDASAYVEARVRGLAAKAVAVLVDGKSVGNWTLTKGETRVVVARATAPVTLAPGGHELALRFVGGPRGGDALAEIDWAHVGTGDPGATYAAPTRADALVHGNVGGRSMRAISLHAPGFARCSGWIPAEATLEASLATAGGGDAEVEARLLRDRRPPVVLGTARIAGGSGWVPWTLPIAGLEGTGALASIELVVRRADPSTRALFGTPRVIAARPVASAVHPRARGVVLVVLGSTSAKSLAPWGGPHAAPEMGRLVSSGALFTANRASSAMAHAVVASMLTGLPPTALGLRDPDARLPKWPTTVAEACRQAGVATAMFTANPTTGAAFGFDRGWDTFVVHDPTEDVPSTRVFDDASAWIEEHKSDPFLVVVHARGGHPPWDASLDELKTMQPLGYLGILEPHRAAEVLAKARKHAGHLKDEDRVRAFSLYDRALDVHDEALGHLLGALRSSGREDDTAVIVTGDVAASEAGPVPFVDAETVDEAVLATPLVVRWPHAPALSGQRFDAPTSPDDLARTVLAVLALPPPPTFGGVDLVDVARGTLVPAERPLAATYGGRFAVRWGPFVLVGARERESRMCDLLLDPTCVADVRATSPLALEPIHRWARSALAPVTPPPMPREGADIDAHTKAALIRWGRPNDEREAEEAPN
ncbi:MAG: sulfatase-like hydrolase/transferase [Myxococcales bacterium]|nr:sulfatase-like hydrolase/transferase [Myxococcales bacterium]